METNCKEGKSSRVKVQVYLTFLASYNLSLCHLELQNIVVETEKVEYTG